MKLIDNAQLSSIANRISEAAIDCTLDFRLESYSCKMISNEKKSFRTFGNSNGLTLVEEGHMPPLGTSLNVPQTQPTRFRHFSERSASGSDNDVSDENHSSVTTELSRKTLFNMSLALNNCFPDYDFSNIKSSNFEAISSYDIQVVDLVDKQLCSMIDGYGINLQQDMWKAIEDEIQPRDCAIYRFQSNTYDDPFTENGVLWALNFILYNKSLRRMLLFAVRVLQYQNSDEGIDDVEDWDMD